MPLEWPLEPNEHLLSLIRRIRQPLTVGVSPIFATRLTAFSSDTSIKSLIVEAAGDNLGCSWVLTRHGQRPI